MSKEKNEWYAFHAVPENFLDNEYMSWEYVKEPWPYDFVNFEGRYTGTSIPGPDTCEILKDIMKPGDKLARWTLYFGPLAAQGGYLIMRDDKPILANREWLS